MIVVAVPRHAVDKIVEGAGVELEVSDRANAPVHGFPTFGGVYEVLYPAGVAKVEVGPEQMLQDLKQEAISHGDVDQTGGVEGFCKDLYQLWDGEESH